MQDGRNDMPTLTPPNEWVSVEERLPQLRENVLVCAYWHEHWGVYIGWNNGHGWTVSCGIGQRNDVQVSHWMLLPAPPDKDNNVPGKTQNEPLTLEQLREMDGEPVWVEFEDGSGGLWGIVHITIFAQIVFANGLHCTIGERYYGKSYKAYRRPPEGEVDGK